MDSQRSAEWCGRMVRSWHLAMLRFAVTRDNADRLGVLAIANEIDGLGRQSKEPPEFRFFRDTSSKLCAAILQQDDTAEAILRQNLLQIDDVRLKRALAAALGIEQKTRETGPPKSNAALWRGLPTRRDAQH
jgi:hypothetical protein